MPSEPLFALRLRRALQRAARFLAARGLVAATDGNLSARLAPDRFLFSPSGLAKAELTAAAILLCDETGRLLSGRGTVTTEAQLHLAAYRARPDIGAVVHAHPPLATAFTLARRESLFCEPFLPEVTASFGPVPTVPYFTPGSDLLAQTAENYFRSYDVVLLAHHGAVALAGDPWLACLRLEKLEHAAAILKSALELSGSTARLRRLKRSQVEALFTAAGRPLPAWFSWGLPSSSTPLPRAQ